jgi:hypothetical protein
MARISARLKAVALVTGVLALSAVAPVTASAATARPTIATVTCYGGAVPVTLPANGWSKTFTKSSRCNDINLKITSGGGQWVAVCWAAHNTCQSSWTWVPEDGSFHVVASNVITGTTFYFAEAAGGGTRQGYVAA